MTLRFFSVTAAVAVLAVSLALPSATTGEVAFVSSMGGTEQVYLINDDGTGMRKLTTIAPSRDDRLAPPTVSALCWSPDGSDLVFFRDTMYQDSDTYHSIRLYLLRDLTDLVVLREWSDEECPSEGSPSLFQPIRWSPDGQCLYFARSAQDDTPILYRISIDGPAAMRSVLSRCLDPTVNPADSTIAYARYRATPNDDAQMWMCDGIWTAHPDGGSQREVAQVEGASHSCPAWSPDGASLAFSYEAGGTTAVGVVQPGRRKVRTIATDCGLGPMYPWSPDGSSLLAMGPNGVYIINTGSGDPRCVLQGLGPDDQIDACEWSPDGAKLVFSRGRSGRDRWLSNVGVVNVDGSGKRQLAKQGEHPTWRPVP